MKLQKYYTLYDCPDTEKIFTLLNSLQEEEKIEYQMVDGSEWEVFKIKDINLSEDELKELLKEFVKFDVAQYEYVLDEVQDEKSWEDSTDNSYEDDWYSDPNGDSYSHEDY